MKCALLREMEQTNPDFDPQEAAEARLARIPYAVPRTRQAPAGTEIEHPDAWRLVRLGVAKPVDDECRQAANISDDELARLAAKYTRLSKGIGTGIPQFDAAPAETAESDDVE